MSLGKVIDAGPKIVAPGELDFVGALRARHKELQGKVRFLEGLDESQHCPWWERLRQRILAKAAARAAVSATT